MLEALRAWEYGDMEDEVGGGGDDIRGFIANGRSLLSRCGNRLGRVIVKTNTFRNPDDAKTTSEKTVAAQGTVFPVNVIQRVIAMGSTYRWFSQIFVYVI